MKSIDVKSLLIGALLASTIFLGVAAVPSGTAVPLKSGWDSFIGPAQWDDKQKWDVKIWNSETRAGIWDTTGWEPMTGCWHSIDKHVIYYRKRIK
jgi:hypothetical protein